MPDQRYDASRQTVGSLLSTTSPRIEVPEWQRSYSWDTAQVQAFWEDLYQFDAQYPGDNIINEEYFLGSIVLVTTAGANLLLDGQQRLATATILLSVLRNARRDFKQDAATRLQHKYISELDDQSDTTTYVLTLNHYDRDFFRAEIQDVPAKPPIRPTPQIKSHGLIRRARTYFEAQVLEASKSLGGGEAAFHWNLRVARVLCDHMSVVAVSSSDEDNAAAVFETLNDRGIGLSTPDLLRNLLLRRAPDADSRARIVTAWGAVLGINDEVSVDEYLRHYWVSKRGDVKARKLYTEIREKVIAEGIDPLELSLDLAEAAPVYRDLARAREEDAELRRLLEGIRALGAKALYPLLLSGYAILEKEPEQLRALAAAATTMFVRYNVIGGRESTVMESTVYGIAAQLRQGKDVTAAITALAALAPDADEFVSRFARVSVPRIATARYLLREIEQAKRITQELTVEATDRVHVEHIYPQTPAGDPWPKHAAWVNRLGNMTLLGKRLNTSVKNADFATKKEKAYENSDILMTKELLASSVWDAGAVEARQHELSGWAFQVWHFPGEQPPAGTGPNLDQEEGDVAPDQLPESPVA